MNLKTLEKWLNFSIANFMSFIIASKSCFFYYPARGEDQQCWTLRVLRAYLKNASRPKGVLLPTTHGVKIEETVGRGGERALRHFLAVHRSRHFTSP